MSDESPDSKLLHDKIHTDTAILKWQLLSLLALGLVYGLLRQQGVIRSNWVFFAVAAAYLLFWYGYLLVFE